MVDLPDVPQADGLRILLAHDLSPAADVATGLIAQLAWPPSTVVRVVSSSMGLGPPLSSFAHLREVRAHSREVRTMILRGHERILGDLARAGVAGESAILRGRPERAIVADAERFGADLIVVGARGQGSMEATILGSVSRAVAERAACSVLVVRTGAARRVLLATDGSPPARYATSVVATWPMFRDAQVLVVAVGQAPPRYPRAVLGDAAWRSAFRDSLATSTDAACDLVEQAAAELSAPDRDVEVEIRLGDADTEVQAAARGWPAELVVVGSNGRPLLQRLFQGSVVRTLLDGVSSSVFVARPPAP